MTSNYISILLGNFVLWYTTYRMVLKENNPLILLSILLFSFIYHAIQGYIQPAELTRSLAVGQVSGLFPNPNSLGFTMWYGIVTATFLLFNISGGKLKKIGLLLLIILFLLVLFKSGSRKNVIAVGLFVLVLFYYLGKTQYRNIIILLSVVLFLFFDLFGKEYVESTAFGARISSEAIDKSSDTRGGLIVEGLVIFSEHPLLGVGLGSFTSYSSRGLMAHNDYIEILASTGLIGFLLYMPIYWYFYKNNVFLLHYKSTYKWGVLFNAFLFGFLILGMGRPTVLDPIAILILAFFHSLSYKKVSEFRSQYKIQKKKFDAYMPYHQHA